MNTNKELDQIVRTWLEDRAAEPSRASLEHALERVATTPQHRRRWLGRWFGLGRGSGATRSAGDRGSPSDSDSGRNRLMFGITTLAASAAALVLAAALVIPRAGPVSEPVPGAGSGVTHVVAADGSGDFTTISEAVAAAAEGDTVLVKPGEYAEIVLVDKDITLQGDGAREGVVLAPPEGPPADPDADIPSTLTVQDSNATIASLTIVSPSGWGTVYVVGGTPTFEDVALLSADIPDSAGTFYFAGGTTAVVRGSSFDGFWLVEDSSPTIEENTASGDAVILGASQPVLRGNAFTGCCLVVASEDAKTATSATIEDNTFDRGDGPDTQAGNRHPGQHGDGPGRRQHGDRHGGRGLGHRRGRGDDPGQRADRQQPRIAWASASGSGTIEGNTVSGGVTGIVVTGGSPSVVDNTVEGASNRGISIGSTASPSISGNTVCGSQVNLYLSENASPQIGENEICPDAPAE